MSRIWLAVCADNDAAAVIQEGVSAFRQKRGTEVTVEWFSRREDLLYRLRESRFCTVIVAQNGALGMETVIGVREIDPDVPLVWVSDKKEFVPQSYRLRTTLFMLKPPTEEQVRSALERCLEDRLRKRK